jgi:metallo-beta-lactamase class B
VRFSFVAVAAAFLTSAPLSAQSPPDSVRRAQECPRCAEWNVPQKPVRVFGNTFYVGTHGLGSILVTSPAGHVLIDGALPESAPLILANIRALGFRPQDVRIILNSHAHYDHASGIATLQAATGARVDASPWSAAVIRRGTSDDRDPQFGLALPFPGASAVDVVADGQVVRVGDLALTAHFTGGHTPGGTTWTWRSCEGAQCFDMVYADSQSPVSADTFLFTRSPTYPTGITDFEHSSGVLEHLACDILVTPHPEASNFWGRVAARDSGDAQALVDRDACRRYAADARRQLAARLARENGAKP